MARLRHLGRHAHQTVVEHVKAELTAGGWFEALATNRPFSTDIVTLREVDFETATDIEPNTVSVTSPSEDPDDEAELGGGNLQRPLEIWVDVYGASPSIARALAEDIKDALTFETLIVQDFTQSPPVDATAYIEIEQVFIDRPPSSYGAMDFKRNWRAITVGATLYFEAT